MKTKIAVVFGIGAVIGLCTAVPSAWAQYDNSLDTVHCETITKGSLKFKPPLNAVDNGPSVDGIKVGGTLGGCSSPSNPLLVFPDGKSKFKGVLSSPTSLCTGLLGPSNANGTLTFTWKVVPPLPDTAVLFKTSTVTISAGDTIGAFTAVGGGTYGQFLLGTPNGAGALAVTGAFTGPGGAGANSGGIVYSQQAVATLAGQCALPQPLGIKAINIGLGQIDLQ